MGNNNSRTNDNKKKSEEIDPDISRAFNALLTEGSEVLKAEQIKHGFGSRLGLKIWTRFMQEKGTETIDFSAFCKIAHELLALNDRTLIELLLPPENLIEICLESGGIALDASKDEEFLNSVASNLANKDAEQIIRWKNLNVPRLLAPIYWKINAALMKATSQSYERQPPVSSVATPTQMFVLSLCLPDLPYFGSSTSGAVSAWTMLYSSAQNGISTTRFEQGVFDYRGPTVSIVELNDSALYAIAADQEWRQSLKKFGGPNSMLVRLRPSFLVVSFTEPAIYCNMKSRTQTLGISVGNELKIDENLETVSAIEIWGLGDAATLAEQSRQKLVQKRAAEQRSKVPLPGNWDENPDKTIMEMHGFQFSAEKRD